jgi:hypothetical protein
MITDKWRDTNHEGPSSRIEGNLRLEVWCANKVKHESVLQDVWMGSITRVNPKPGQLKLVAVSDGWHRTKAEAMAWCDLSVKGWL